jgi:dolichol-phosphate mannosyltransferase
MTRPNIGTNVIELSVVIPVYGCEPCLRALNQRLTSALEDLGVTHEIVYVDDRSPDLAWTTLSELAASLPHVRSIRLSRNFGQHAAITAGLARAEGRWVVVMDCDLQDRPEHVAELYAKAREGYDVVFARRKARKDSWFRRLGARTYFWVLGVFSGTKLEGEFGTFSIVSRKMVDAFLDLNDADRHYVFILRWLGFESAVIDVEHCERAEGRSSYTLSKLVQHAFDGLVFQTTRLLRWIVYAGFVIAFLGLALAAFYLYSWAQHRPYPGWTTLVVLLLVLSGFILLSLGVTGLYVGKIFSQVKGRPLYIVDEERTMSVTVNLPEPRSQETLRASSR